MGIFDLNEMMSMNDNTVKVFNNGIAGKVENVTLKVVKKGLDEGEKNPDYNVIYVDKNGCELKDGFYYNRVQPKNELSEEENNKKIQSYLNRILSVSNSVLLEDFKYPNVNNGKEAMDALFKIIKDNSEGKKLNVFVTYGTKDYPSKFLKPRYFNFIEKAENTGYSRLIPKGDDQMERIKEDAPQTDNNTSGTSNQAAAW